ncbi:hypothetical protein [Gordonia rubripertincta]|jgi:hypothetical protein|uniref:Polyketide cyclase / dehydrase and lipid transport n=1 Tax=Gordonia rubripertincta TaxID=36822 RepID=A0ABT4N2C1_GORRU|nr:hypothetical protein [Gordonia rubripertincta]MCZ4552446.1 hypothetical protein [Gordonia rubripertincta]
MTAHLSLATRSPLRLFIPTRCGAAPVDPSDARQWREFTDPSGDVTFIRSDYLAGAHRLTQNLRSRSSSPTSQPTAVVLQIEVVIDRDPATARLALGGEPRRVDDGRPTFQFVGSPAGLTGLVADIYIAEVADGVAFVPLLRAQHAQDICGDVAARLRRRGMMS